MQKYFVDIVSDLPEWVRERKQENAHLTLFSLNVDLNSLDAEYGSEGLSKASKVLSVAAEAWHLGSGSGGLHLSAVVRWHNVNGASFAPRSSLLSPLRLLFQEAAHRLSERAYIACGICTISDRAGFRVFEATTKELAIMMQAAETALAAAMRHSRRSSLFNIDPDSFWASGTEWDGEETGNGPYSGEVQLEDQ